MRGILFDKDGTLLDFEATWTPVLRRLALEAAGGAEAKAAALLEAGGFVAETGRFRAGSVIGAGTTELIVRLWHPGASDTEFAEFVARMDRAFHDHGRSHSIPIAGVVAALEILAARGFVMGIATNDTTSAAKAALASTGMARHLPYIFGYDSVLRSKPAVDMVHAFAEASGLPPAEIVVVGDNAHDLEMARSAGALAIGVTSGNSSADDLAALADAILPSVRELPAWLDQNRK
jgi:phosphoglycolate phosphatase